MSEIRGKKFFQRLLSWFLLSPSFIPFQSHHQLQAGILVSCTVFLGQFSASQDLLTSLTSAFSVPTCLISWVHSHEGNIFWRRHVTAQWVLKCMFSLVEIKSWWKSPVNTCVRCDCHWVVGAGLCAAWNALHVEGFENEVQRGDSFLFPNYIFLAMLSI